MILKIMALMSSFVTLSASGSFLPPNNLHLEDSVLLNSNITEQDFNRIIREAEAIYGPIIRINHQNTLEVRNLWNSNIVNASATQLEFNRIWRVEMYGGLARRPEVTQDGFAMVLCHELGHHLGGYPFSRAWAGNEGQADYFATLTCAREIWRDDLEINATFRDTVTPIAQALCDQAWPAVEQQNLCYRSMAAGQSLGNFLANGQFPRIDTPDQSVVERTNSRHPAAQCRLDTYVAGALCDAEWDVTFIPAKDLGGAKRDTPEAEAISAEYTCTRAAGFEFGIRPSCWFANKL